MEVKPGYKRTEVGIIPVDWEVRPLQSTCKSIYESASPRPIGDPRWFDDYAAIGWVRIADVTDSKRYLYKTTQRLSAEGIRRSRFIPRGSLIMSICATVGRPIETAIDTCIHDGFVMFEHPNVHQGFLYHVLSDLEPRWSLKGQTGSQMNLNTTLIKTTTVPVPNALREQEAIATALDDVDSLIDGLERLIGKKPDLKQAAMQQLLTARTRLPGFAGEWQTKRIGEVVDTDPECLCADTAPDYAFNYISLEDVDRGVLRSYSEQTFRTAPSRVRRRIWPDDVLVSTVRPNLLSHLHFAEGGDDWICSTGFCVLRCRERVSHPRYIFSQLFSDGVRRQIDALLTGSNYPAISSADVRAIEISFPEYAEQTAIAAVLADMDAEIAALEARRDKTRLLKQAMMQELLTGKKRLV